MTTPNPQTLLKISLIISFIGIFLLFFLSSFEPQTTAISNVLKLSENQLVKLQGNITKTQDKDSFFILTLQDATGKINIISEKNFQENSTIEVLGKTEVFNNKTQVRAERIKQIK